MKVKYVVWHCVKCDDICKDDGPPCIFMRPSEYVSEGRDHIWRNCPFGDKARFKYVKDVMMDPEAED